MDEREIQVAAQRAQRLEEKRDVKIPWDENGAAKPHQNAACSKTKKIADDEQHVHLLTRIELAGIRNLDLGVEHAQR